MPEGAGCALPLQVSILMSTATVLLVLSCRNRRVARKQARLGELTAMSGQGIGSVRPEQQVVVSFTVDKAGIEVLARCVSNSVKAAPAIREVTVVTAINICINRLAQTAEGSSG